MLEFKQHENLSKTMIPAMEADPKVPPAKGIANKPRIHHRGGRCTVFGYCDNSMRSKDWHCRKRGAQAT